MCVQSARVVSEIVNETEKMAKVVQDTVSNNNSTAAVRASRPLTACVDSALD
jgi:hypothetical protein